MDESSILAAMLGMSAGSFVNLLTFRLPKSLSIVFGRSACDNCGKALAWHQLVPVVGYILHRGRCPKCNLRIPTLYPIIELALALTAIFLVHREGLSTEALMVFCFSSLCVAIAIIDWQHLIIPNQLVVAGVALGILHSATGPDAPLDLYVFSSGASFSLLLAIRWVASIIMCREAMGFGDVKLAAVLGLFCGFWLFLLSLWVASLIGAGYGLTRAQFRITPANSFLPTAYPSTRSPLATSLGALSERSESRGCILPTALSYPVSASPMPAKLPFGSFLAGSALPVFFFKDEITMFLESLWI